MTTNRDASYYTKVTYTGMTEYDFDMAAVWDKIASHERARRIWVEETPMHRPASAITAAGAPASICCFLAGRTTPARRSSHDAS